jgi:phenylacetate-CoA ligase
MKARLRYFQENETKSPLEIEKLRWTSINRILLHAEKNVPYYKKLFSENRLNPAEIRDYPSFTQIPILKRSDSQKHLDKLAAENFDRKSLRRSSTGGSTGQPTPFFHDREYEQQNAALIYRNLFWTGWDYERPIVKIWGSVVDLTTQQRFSEKMTNYMKRITIFPAYEMNFENILKWSKKICQNRPYLIEGYAQVMVTFAKICQQTGIRLDDIGIKAVIPTAEMLYPLDRDILENFFKCPIFNRYGHREMSTIAQECQYGNMHINEDWLFVEILDENAQPVVPGKVGEVVVTGLYNKGMPFIRYATQDIAMIDPQTSCQCGRNFRSLKNLQGRVQDLISLPDGSLLSGIFFPAILKVYDLVQFQIVQRTINQLDIYMIRGEHFTDTDLEEIRAKMGQYIRGVDIHFHCVESIPIPPSGKHRYTISDVTPTDRSRIVLP